MKKSQFQQNKYYNDDELEDILLGEQWILINRVFYRALKSDKFCASTCPDGGAYILEISRLIGVAAKYKCVRFDSHVKKADKEAEINKFMKSFRRMEEEADVLNSSTISLLEKAKPKQLLLF